MKRKTATFVIYTPYGTSVSNRILDVRYRGKLLYEFSGSDESELIARAQRFAGGMGFTCSRVQYVVGGG